MTSTPVVDGWFTTGEEPHLLASRCTTCSNVVFPPVSADAGAAAFYCRNPACDGEEHVAVELSRHGTVWSYTDAQYQPPAPYVPQSDPFEPFALAAVELPEGIVVLGQVAAGYGVGDLKVGDEVELVVETLEAGDGDEAPDLLTYRWKPVGGAR